jgi:hypothetical protein
MPTVEHQTDPPTAHAGPRQETDGQRSATKACG